MMSGSAFGAAFVYCGPQRPCPICGATKNCRYKPDGLYFCYYVRTDDGPPDVVFMGEARDGLWGVFKKASYVWNDYAANDYKASGTAGDGAAGDNGDAAITAADSDDVHDDFRGIITSKGERLTNSEFMQRHIASDKRPMSPAARRLLAKTLQLPAEVFDSMPVEFLQNDTYNRAAWVIPEKTPDGDLTCYTLRYLDGHKLAFGRRGLVMPDGWYHHGGPLVCPEGASDTMALHAIGVSAVGRPNNIGGAEHLAELLADFDSDRPIIILGENDQHEDGRWPGREGAESVAGKLAMRLNREIGRDIIIAYPPDGFKDVRTWFIAARQASPNTLLDELGEQFIASLVTLALPPTPAAPIVVTMASPAPPAITSPAAEQTPLAKLPPVVSPLAKLPPVVTPFPACPNPRGVFMKRIDGTYGRVQYHRCKKCSCDGCLPVKKDQWKATIKKRLEDFAECQPLMQIFLFRCDRHEWSKVYADVRRHRSNYFRIEPVCGGGYLVGSTVRPKSIVSVERLWPEEVASRLCGAIELIQPVEYKPFTSSRPWKLLSEEKKKEKKAQRWVRLGKVSSQPIDVLRILDRRNLKWEAKRQDRRWWGWRGIQFPLAPLSKAGIDVDHLYQEICEGDLLPTDEQIGRLGFGKARDGENIEGANIEFAVEL